MIEMMKGFTHAIIGYCMSIYDHSLTNHARVVKAGIVKELLNDIIREAQDAIEYLDEQEVKEKANGS